MFALLIAKALVSVGIVVGLSVVAERAGPRLAGLLIGLPLGAGMVVVFTGVEQGAAFSAASAVHMVPSFITTIVFIYTYATIAARQNRGGVGGVIAPSLAAHAAYGVAAFAVSQVQLPLSISVPLIIAAIVIGKWIMKALPDTPILNRVTFGWRVLVFRAGMATAVILIITGVAGAVGPQWTGILTAYPITLYPSVLVLHITYRGEEVAAVLKHVPLALGCVTAFCIVVVFAVPALGLGWGTVAAYAVAAVYLIGYSAISRLVRGRDKVET